MSRHAEPSRHGDRGTCRLPSILMIIALGSIEATNAIFLKEHLTSAAYKGAARGDYPGPD